MKLSINLGVGGISNLPVRYAVLYSDATSVQYLFVATHPCRGTVLCLWIPLARRNQSCRNTLPAWVDSFDPPNPVPINAVRSRLFLLFLLPSMGIVPQGVDTEKPTSESRAIGAASLYNRTELVLFDRRMDFYLLCFSLYSSILIHFLYDLLATNY